MEISLPKITILTGLMLYCTSVAAQVKMANTADGKRIILNKNGTWKYDDKKDTAARPTYSELAAKLEQCGQLAMTAQQDALKNERRARVAEQQAQRERYLAIANAIALKSKESTEAEQGSLLALQAFNFNNNHKGYAYSNNIYNAVYSAVKKYDAPQTRSMTGHTGDVRALVTSKASNVIFSAGTDGRILRWRPQDQTWVSETLAADRNNHQIYSIDVSPNDNLLVAGGHSESNAVELYDLRNPGSGPKQIKGYKSDILNISFTPDSKGMYALCNSGKSIVFSDLITAREVITPKEKIISMKLSPDGNKLMGAGAEGNLYVWDTRKNFAVTVYPIFEKGKGITSLCIMADNRSIVIGTENGEVHFVFEGKVTRTLSGHWAAIRQIEFSQSGTFMATASNDKTVRLWNLANLREQPIILSDHDWVLSLAFSSDDKQLMSGFKYSGSVPIGPIRAWPTTIPEMASGLCSHLTRNMTKDEWDLFVGEDLPYEKTCANLPANNK